MSQTITKQHNWVKHVITPVVVLEGSQGQPVVLVDPDDQNISEDHAVYGCDSCSVPMTDRTLHTDCEPEDESA